MVRLLVLFTLASSLSGCGLLYFALQHIGELH